MTDDATSVSEKVRAWIMDSGASFEMAVAKQMLNAGLGVEQGRYYTDPDEDKLREIDVIANTANAIGEDVAMGLAAVIECKYAPTPWVLFGPPPTSAMTETSFTRIATRLGNAFLADADSVPALRHLRMFRRDCDPGYALATSNPGHKNDRSKAQPDLAYAALQTVIKASLALANERDAVNTPRWMTTIFPVIAVRGQVYECWLQNDGDVFVAETNRCQIDYSYPSAPSGRVLVDIVTETALPQLALDLVAASGGMVTQASELGRQAAAKVRAADRPPIVIPRRLR